MLPSENEKTERGKAINCSLQNGKNLETKREKSPCYQKAILK
jgi:hypothetical protein